MSEQQNKVYKIKVVESFQNTSPVEEKTLKRSSNLKQLLNESEFAEIVDESPDFTLYFDTDFLTSEADKSVIELIQYKDNESLGKSILDITSTDIFDDEHKSPLLTLCTVCAGFVTCPDAITQEAIYEATGRLAHIVENPLLSERLKEPDLDEDKNVNNPRILWFGLPNEIFSIRAEQVKFKDKYNIRTTVINSATSQRKVQKSFDLADLIYLPPTSLQHSEENRGIKVQLGLLEGKFVIAPDLLEPIEGLTYNGSLEEGLDYYKNNNITEWIKEKQKILLENEGVNKSLSQMIKAIELAEEDDFLDNIDYFLESEKIII